MRTNKQWRDSRANSHCGLVPHPTEVEREDWEARPCLELADKPIHPREQLLPTSPGPGCILKTLGRESGSPDGCRCLLAQATACGLASPLPRFSPGHLPKRESATANMLPENVCRPGVSRVLWLQATCAEWPTPQIQRETVLLLLASVMNRKKKASASPTQWTGI